MRSPLDDAPFVEDDDLVGVHQRRKPMGDYDRGLGLGGLRQGFTDATLGHGIDGGGGIVEYHHAGAGHHATGNRHTLTLAARKRHAPFADARLVCAGKTGDIVVDLGRPGRLDDAHFLRPGIGIGDVVGHRRIEQEGFLLNKSDVVAQGGQSHITHVLAVDGDAPTCDVIEARRQSGDGRLARPRRSDDPERCAGSNLEADVVENGLSGLVGKIHMIEPQNAGRGDKVVGARLVGDLRPEVEDLKQPAARGGCARGRSEDHGDLPDRALQERHVGQEFSQAPRRHFSLSDLVAAHPEQKPHGDVEADGHHRNGAETQHDSAVGIGKGRIGGLVELGHFEGLGREGSHDADALEVFFHGQRQEAHQRLDMEPGDTQQETHARQRPAGNGYEPQAQRRHKRVGGDHHPGGDAEQQDQRQESHHPVLNERPGALQIEHAAGDKIA